MLFTYVLLALTAIILISFILSAPKTNSVLTSLILLVYTIIVATWNVISYTDSQVADATDIIRSYIITLAGEDRDANCKQIRTYLDDKLHYEAVRCKDEGTYYVITYYDPSAGKEITVKIKEEKNV